MSKRLGRRILNENQNLINKRKNVQCSSQEKWIMKILKSNGIVFFREKTFLGLFNPKTRKPLFFDFYLPKYKVIIEFDGPQHFKPVYGEENLVQLKGRDRIKNSFCRKKGFKLLRIPYWKKDIEKEICKFFDKHFPTVS